MKKVLVVCIIVLFLIVSVTSTIGISKNDDTTPPVTTCTLDPPEPNGNNGWYVSNVTVTLKATDDLSGVKEIHYLVDGEWKVQSGDLVIFILDPDCGSGTEFYAVDNAGNQEARHIVIIKIDQLSPIVTLSYEIIGGNPREGWDIVFTAEAIDSCSGIDRVEFHANTRYNSYFLGTFYGPGPIYQCGFRYSPIKRISGLILFKEITEEFVNFFALLILISTEGFIYPHVDAYDNAGNTCWTETGGPMFDDSGIGLFRNVKLLNNFKGYIGKYFIFAKFDEYIDKSEVR